MRYQLREWLKATLVFAVAAACLWGAWATFILPPRVIYGQGGGKVDAYVYCEQQAYPIADEEITPEVRALAGDIRRECMSRSAIDTGQLAIQLLVTALLGFAAWRLLLAAA